MICPLLSIIRKGTFITMPSASEDLNNAFIPQNANNGFQFSHFALLNIPNIKPTLGGNVQNSVDFLNIEGHFVQGLNTQNIDPNAQNKLDLSESFQNYVLNFEANLTSQETYNRANLNTVSERIFFKWLKEIGALRFQEATNTKKVSTVTEKRFLEEDNVVNLYERCVQYVGAVEMQGSNFKQNENQFNEVYINIPSQNGNTPTVLFKSLSDENYNENTIVQAVVNPEFIKGRDETDNPTSAGLTVEAIYDVDVAVGGVDYLVNGVSTPTSWYGSKATNTNAYITDSVFNDPTTDTITRTDGSTTLIFKRSRLDGISIDFDIENYQEVVDYNEANSDQITTFTQFNSTTSSTNFNFNVMLLYYDVYDSVDTTLRATNLFGVLFLDDIISVVDNISKINTLQKIKQSNFLGNTGNGYGLKLNFKFDVSTNSVDKKIEVSVNDYNTMSMSMFVDAMNNIQLLSRNYEEMLVYNKSLITQNEEYQRLLSDSNLMSTVSTILNNQNILLVDNVNEEEILALIEKQQTQITKILQGETSVDVNILFAVNGFQGITAIVDGQNISLTNNAQIYNNIIKKNFDLSAGNVSAVENIITLNPLSTLVYHENGFIEKVAQANLILKVDDSANKWKKGQTMRIVFNHAIDMQNFAIYIYTDENGSASGSNTPYSKLIGTIDELGTERYPVFDITCVDVTTYDFIMTRIQ